MNAMENNQYRRLTRSIADRRIAGVCGGIAKYLNVDPTVVRILFLAALLFGMAGLWVYLVVWLVAPEEGALQ